MGAAKRRVLVIDDDRPCRELLCEALEDEGYEVRGATNGRAGLAVLRDWRPDLIVLDLVMPDMDGLAFQSKQRGNGFADIPVLLLSAARDLAAQAEALGLSALSKPFQLDELLEQVDGLTSRRAG
jgi:two-component system OmpR family response regulator